MPNLTGPIKPEALGGYKLVSRNSDQHTKRTETYMPKSKGASLRLFRSFEQYVLINFGVHIERLRDDKVGEDINKEFKYYYLGTGVSLEYAGTNTPQ